MKERIITVGNSPLAFLIARGLDQSFGDLVHRELLWVTQSQEQVHLPSLRSIFHLKTFNQKNQLTHTKTSNEKIKAVRLKDRQIITSKRVLDYDYLILDQTPTYTPLELKAIAREITTLLTNLQARSQVRKDQLVQIYCQGKTTESWQLALLIRSAVKHFHTTLNSQVEVVVDQPGIDITKFLKAEGVKILSSAGSLPGFRIQAPSVPVELKKIKGLRIDRAGRAVINKSFSPEDYSEVLIFDQESSERTNILKVWHSQAKQIVGHLGRKLEQQQTTDLHVPDQAVLLNGQQRSFLSLGSLQSGRTRAQIVRQLDRRFYQRLS